MLYFDIIVSWHIIFLDIYDMIDACGNYMHVFLCDYDYMMYDEMHVFLIFLCFSNVMQMWMYEMQMNMIMQMIMYMMRM